MLRSDRDILNELSFNPFLLNDTVTGNNYLGPDHQFHNIYTNQFGSYLLEDDFNSRCQNITSSNFFSLIHFNARSLSKNTENISNYLNLLNNEFSVIGISETWLSSSNSIPSFISIPNYKFISCCGEQQQGGGIGIYVNRKFDFKERSDLGINDDDICQSRFIELNVIDKTIIVGILYRPPNSNIRNLWNI